MEPSGTACLNFRNVVLVVSSKRASKCHKINTARCGLQPELQVLNFQLDKAHSCATAKPHDIVRQIGVKMLSALGLCGSSGSHLTDGWFPCL